MSKESMKLALEPQQEPMRECNPIDCQYIDGLGKTDCDWCRPKKSTLPAAPVHQTCNCRWDGEVQVQQCTLHQAHVDAIHEWAERAKAAEAKLAAQPAPVQEPVAMRMPKVGDKVVCIDDESLGTVVYLTAGGSPEIKFDDGSHGTYMLREFAELFGYTTPPAQEFICSTGLCHYKPAAAVQERTDYTVHLNHCNIGECEGVCKYGDDDCPALKHSDMKAKWDRPTPPAAQRQWVGLTDEQKLDVVTDYFDHVDGDWAVKKASQLLDAYESKLKELNT